MKSSVFFSPPPTPELNLEFSCRGDVKALKGFVFSTKSYDILKETMLIVTQILTELMFQSISSMHLRSIKYFIKFIFIKLILSLRYCQLVGLCMCSINIKIFKTVIKALNLTNFDSGVSNFDVQYNSIKYIFYTSENSLKFIGVI